MKRRTRIARTPHGRLLLGDCADLLKKQRSGSVDLIVTSPPYGDNRRTTYQGVKTGEYVTWFVPIARQMYRVLKDDGSLILNVKERVIKGERGTYVIELILAMRQLGWRWTEEYVWTKKNSYPGKWPNRFRDAWERCLHFTKQRQFRMYQDEMKIPLGKWAERRLANVRPYDLIRQTSAVGSPFGKKVANWIGKTHVYPTNVLNLATESRNRGHSATFPVSLPENFIRLFTCPGDTVLDPFIGSGTTALAAIGLERRYVGIEISADYFDLAAGRLLAFEHLQSNTDLSGGAPRKVAASRADVGRRKTAIRRVAAARSRS